jgi:hypothetical protein
MIGCFTPYPQGCGRVAKRFTREVVMNHKYSKLAGLTATLMLVANSAMAIVLWDQSNLVANGDGSLNLASNSCSQISGNTRIHNTSDVSFPQPVILTKITIFESAGNVQAATQAYLSILPKTGPFPTVPSDSLYNPSHLVNITATPVTQNGLSCIAVSCTLNKVLPAGDYWISLTPRHNRGIFPYTVHHYTQGPIIGVPTRAIDACTVNSNWFTPLESFNPAGFDYSIRVEGDFPVPANSSTWGRLKTIYR